MELSSLHIDKELKSGRAALSVAIITKNEEKNLPECLKSAAFADEVVVVDSGSTDSTVDIAKECGCRVFVEEWKGYGPQKNSAVDKCRHNWVIVIDADERVPEETAEEILRTLEGHPGADAYSFPRKNFFRGRWIKHGGWWPDRTVRLVRRDRGRFQGMTHEVWITIGTVKQLDSFIEHYSFSGYSDMVRVMQTRTDHMAVELYDEGRRAGMLTPFVHGIAMFVSVYFLRRGFLDGFDGLVIATLRARGSYLKYAKLRRLQRCTPGVGREGGQ